jgi:hypothetical protein
VVLVLFPSFEVRAQMMATHSARFAYFAQGDGWWTGLAIYNSDGVYRDYIMQVYDSSGESVVAGTSFSLNRYGQRVGMLSSFITSGSLPFQGSIAILSTGPFIADKFTGNSTMGGFSEVQVTATNLSP